MLIATCVLFIAAQHAALKTEAARQHPQLDLQNATATIAQISPTRNAETQQQASRFNPDLCDEPDAQITATIAHELGHIITDQLYGANLPKQQDEATADLYGAHLLAADVKQDLLALMAQRCTTNQNYCVRAERWAFAFTH